MTPNVSGLVCPTVCDEPFLFEIHLQGYDCEQNWNVSSQWWHNNGTSVHINLSKYYFLGTFFLFLSCVLLIFVVSWFCIFMKRRRRNILTTAAENLRSLVGEMRKGKETEGMTTPVARSFENVFTSAAELAYQEDLESDQGEIDSKSSVRSLDDLV